jgi:beta-lactamase superfamily II metal-dependent hydrolase
MDIRIFDVEHGGCALVTADTGASMLIDCGHNGTTGWRPSNHLYRLGTTYLDQLIVTNYDEDHASDLHNLVRVVRIGHLMTNPSVSGYELKRLKNIGGIGPGIETLAHLKSQFGPPGGSTGPNFGNLSISTFWNMYPTEFQDENNLSLVVILRAYGLTICFPGDMEVAGWKNLLRNPDFVRTIAGVNVLLASHHGRENGCCSELFTQTGLNPAIVVISDSGIEFATQETVNWYRARVRGIALNGETRHVLTTRRDGRILIRSTPLETNVYTGA